MRVVIASHNQGKIRELQAMLADFTIELIPQSALNVPEVEETGLTFIENAIIKARHASLKTGLPALGDDSGLAVRALGGAPGIYSARYAGEEANSDDNIHKLLAALAGVPDVQRQASFHCVLAFMTHSNDPTPLVCDGAWHGSILHEKKGKNGFGYDPIFQVPSLNQSAAELDEDIKNKISHRGIAIGLLKDMLRSR